MGLVAGVDQGAAGHGVDAGDDLEEVGALGQLVEARVGLGICLDADLAGAGVDLAGHQEGQQGGDDVVEGDRPGQQVVLVAAVAVALEVGVVLVEADGAPVVAGPGAAPRALQQDAFTGAVEGGQVAQRVDLGGRVLRVGVIVVQARAVGEDQVALELLQRYAAVAVALQVVGLVLVVEQLLDLEAARVAPRVLQLVIPAGDEILAQVAADQLHRLDDDVELLHAVDLDTVLGFETEQPVAQNQMTLPAASASRSRFSPELTGATRTTFSGS